MVKREHILETARRLFFSRGIRAVSMDDVAREAGVSKKTVYAHFPSKEALVRALAEHLLGQLVPLAQALFEEPGAFVENLGRLVSAFGHQLVGVSPAFYEDLAQHYPEAWRIVEEARSRNLARLKELLVAARQQGRVRAELDLDVVTAALGASIQRVLAPEFLTRHPVSPERAMNTLVELFLRGIAREPDR